MIPLLVQISFEAIPSFVMFAIGGSAALFLINQALTFYKEHMREKPVPAATYATKTELAKVENDLKDSLTSLSLELKEEAQAQAGKRKAIYAKIEQLAHDTAGLKADNATQTRQLFNVEQKVDRVLERLPRHQ
jgi:phytoene dehydrogenase-like protein